MRIVRIISFLLCIVGMIVPARGEITFKLKWTENFSKNRLNTKLWKRIGASRPDWCKKMSLRDDLVLVEDGILTIRGIKSGEIEAMSGEVGVDVVIRHWRAMVFVRGWGDEGQ